MTPPSMTATKITAKIAQLAAVGIIARDGV